MEERQRVTAETVVLHACGATGSVGLTKSIGWRAHYCAPKDKESAAYRACQAAVTRGWMTLTKPRNWVGGNLFMVTEEGLAWASAQSGLPILGGT
jgi:hypothetical protein